MLIKCSVSLLLSASLSESPLISPAFLPTSVTSLNFYCSLIYMYWKLNSAHLNPCKNKVACSTHSIVKIIPFVGNVSELLSWLGFSSGNDHGTADGTAELLLGCTSGQAEKESVGPVWCGCRRELKCCCVKQRDGMLQVPIVQHLHCLLVFASLPWSWGVCQPSVQSHAAAASSQPSFWWGSQQGKLMGDSKM